MQILVMKLNDGNTLTHCRSDESYGETAELLAALVAAIVLQTVPSNTCTAYMVGDSTVLDYPGTNIDSDISITEADGVKTLVNAHMP